MADLYIYHHGIQGQKWGVRRFQNPDGSLTEEGKRRYSDYQQNNAKDITRIINSHIRGDVVWGSGYGKYSAARTARKSSALNEAAKAISSSAKKKEIQKIKDRHEALVALDKELNSLKNLYRFGKQANIVREYSEIRKEQYSQISNIIKKSGIAEDLMGKYKDEKVLGYTREERLSDLMTTFADLIFDEEHKR